jgi:hypothetical protein
MKAVLLSFAATLVAAPALAASVNATSFSTSAYNSLVSSMDSAVTQDFESYGEANVANGFSTNVGTFSTVGGVGSGGTVSNAGFDNNGSMLAIRDGNVYGRTSSTATLTSNKANDKFLDSNDTFGILWNVSLGADRMFDRIVFTVTDAAEFGGTFSIGTNGATTNIVNGANAVRNLIEITFDQAVSSATVALSHFSGSRNFTNDGFSVDDIAVSEVPLPASVLLLLGGLGGLAAMRRRKS